MATIWLLSITIGAIWGSSKGRSLDGILLTALTGPAGLIILWSLGAKKPGPEGPG